MSKFKQGDLALIVRDNNPDNVGRCVELIKFILDGENYTTPEGFETRNVSGGSVWLVRAEGLQTRTKNVDWWVSGWTQKAPYNLMPLRGDFAPEQQKSREVAA